MKAFARFHAGIVTIGLLCATLAWAPLAGAESKSNSKDKSDLNSDLVVDFDDLVIFSTNYLQQNWEHVDWCLFHESTVTGATFDGKSTKYYKKHFNLLLAFIYEFAECAGPKLPPEGLVLNNTPKYLMRMAGATDSSGDYFITDPKVGSLFIYDADLVLKEEIKGLDKPLGVAVDSSGYILVGNNGSDNIEVYDRADGKLVTTFGTGLLRMPTAISIGPDGNIYITDSLNHNVKVFDAGYNLAGTIGSAGSGEGELDFPVDTQIITRYEGVALIQEVFVADQGNKRIQVYDLAGNWLRSITYLGDCGMMGCSSPPFTRLQALSVDSYGRLHVLDNFAASVNIFDPGSGVRLGSYGEYGTGAGFLRVPMDVLISGVESSPELDISVVIPGDGSRIEVLDIPW